MKPQVEYLIRDNVRLALHSWVPQKVQAVLFYIPGMQSHAGWLFEAGPEIAKSSIAIFALDRRGSGLSEGLQGDILSAEVLLDDYYCALEKIKKEYPNLPLTLLGQSLGGSILAALISRDSFKIKYDALVFCTSGLGRRHDQLTSDQYQELLKIRTTDLCPMNLPDEEMTDLPYFLDFMQQDPYGFKFMTYRARAALLEIENLYWHKTGVIQNVSSAFVRPEIDPIVNTEAAVKIFMQLTNHNGMVLQLPATKHYLWFTAQRYLLINWLTHYILTAGYKN